MTGKHVDKHVLEQVYKCLRCGWCRDLVQGGTNRVCPSREVLGFESSFGRGRLMVARGIIEGELEPTPELVRQYYTCFGCGMCQEVCPLEVVTLSVFRWQREEAMRLGLDVPAGLKEINETVEEHGNVFGLDNSTRMSWAEGLNMPDNGSLVYFTGCYDSFRSPQSASAGVKTLQKIGYPPAHLGEKEICCGIPQLWNGTTYLARELAEKNVDALQKAGAEKVVFTCAGCYNAFKIYYPELLGEELPFELTHITELYADLMEKGEMELSPVEPARRVTYHDPCHLGRHVGVYEPPRHILKALYPETYVEMPRNRENAWCCGGGAIVFSIFRDLTDSVSETRVQEAKDIDAELIVSSCPTCLNILRLPAQRQRIKVDNIVSQVAKALEIQ